MFFGGSAGFVRFVGFDGFPNGAVLCAQLVPLRGARVGVFEVVAHVVMDDAHQTGGEVTNQHVVRCLGNGLVKRHIRSDGFVEVFAGIGFI